MSSVRIRRVYAPPSPEDGTRILVDRLWPRGVSKAAGRIDLWLKDLSPSDVLRRRVHGGELDWDGFVAAYDEELQAPAAKAAIAQLRTALAAGPVTLLYAAKDQTRNNATALAGLVCV
jgi:uncharacterized protein YeaO (DUF488 family)